MITLTPAESHMLELIKRGYEDLTIARVFGVTVDRIKTMREAAEQKLQSVPAQGEEHWNH